MKYFIFFTLIFSFLSTALFSQINNIKIAPLNPELIKQLNNEKQGTIEKASISGHSLGYLPHSIQYNRSIPFELKKSLALPDSFDLREEGKLTEVKDQSTCGACWTFATYGSIESRWLALGEEIYDFSEQNLKNGNDFEIDHCSGGNASISTAYLTRGRGPILEKDDPYDVGNGDYVSGLTPAGYITDARFLPNDAAILKQALMENGALYTTMYWEDEYYNAVNNTYYFNASTDSSVNHAVLLVGWNNEIQTGGGKGAWIIRNSWGTSFGDSGFFYISYNDVKINTNTAYWPNKIKNNKDAQILLYDKLGAIQEIGIDGSVGYGLVKFIISEGYSLDKVGLWIPSNATLNIEIYDTFDGSILSEKLGSIDNKICNYPGYYTFDLSPIIETIKKGDIYIKVKYDTPNYDYPIPIESLVEGYSNAEITTGNCWLSDNGSNGRWMPIGDDTDYKWDLCVTAYTVAKVTSITNDHSINLPSEFNLQNYPNPFNPSTVISYQLSQPTEVELIIYDVMGKTIRTLIKGNQSAGEHKITFDASGLANGIYFYKLISKNHIQVRKMILMK